MRIIATAGLAIALAMFSAPAFAGDCIKGKELIKAAASVDDIKAALATAFNTKIAEEAAKEHGDTIGEFKNIAEKAIAGCK